MLVLNIVAVQKGIKSAEVLVLEQQTVKLNHADWVALCIALCNYHNQGLLVQMHVKYGEMDMS